VVAGLENGSQTAAARQQTARQQAPVTCHEVTADIYLVKGGSGANTAIYVTPEGVYAIDAKMSAESARAMIDLIKQVSQAELKTVILTHSDGDHINGLPGFPQGLTIIAHENCRKDMEKMSAELPAFKDYLPTRVFKDNLTLSKAEGRRVELLYFGPAHTSGDIVIWFADEEVAFVGDLIFIGREPLIHRHKNGSALGYLSALKKMLALEPAVEIFLSGHADPVGRKELEALAASLEEKIAAVDALIKNGQSLEEVKKAFGIESESSRTGSRRLSLVEVIYLELAGEKTGDSA